MSITVKEETLRDLTRFANPEVAFKGAKVTVTLEQEMYSAAGALVGTAYVTFEGTRDFGRKVTFQNPVNVTAFKVLRPDEAGFAQAGPEDLEYFHEMAQFALEALRDIDSGTK